MKFYEKGTYGYINSYKKNKLIASLLFLAMIVFIVVTLFVMYGDTSRVGVIFAILLALPFAKFFIAYIMVCRFKSMEKERYQKLIDNECDTDARLLFDVVISRYEGMRFFYTVCVKNGKVYALADEKKFSESKKEYEDWLLDAVSDRKYTYKVFIYDDIDAYIKKIKQTSSPNDNTRLIDKHIAEKILEMGV